MNILNEIIEYKKSEVKQQQSNLTSKELVERVANMKPVNSLLSILESRKNQAKVALIAEVKKASPSKGIIRKDFNPVEIALDYQASGAYAISVLTDEKYFQGSIEYLKQVRSVIDLPILRKDFIVDPYQIYETRAIGADIILLIASAMDFSQLKDFYQISKSIGLNVLVEVHDRKEFEFVLDMGAKLIGINNRNLGTFQVSMNTTLELIKNYDIKDKFIISESGINSYNDVDILKKGGITGILVGEYLMRKNDIKKGVYELLGNYL